MKKRVWISWNEQRRNIGLADAVNARLYMTDWNLPKWCRYGKEFYDSWRIVRRDKPSVCFTMNPSIFSSWWLSFLARIYNFRLITDLHTPNIKLTGIKKKLFQMIFNSGIKRSDAVIVSNEMYRKSIESLNRNVVIIPDSLPDLKKPSHDITIKHQKKNNKLQILFVCSFDPDEPINEVLNLDPELDGFDILVCGHWERKFKYPPSLRSIRFLGFVSKDEYDQLLLSVDGIMVLTREEGCLCCGGYEAFSAGKPLILSRTRTLQEHFGTAPIYTENNSSSILNALKILNIEIEKRTKMISEDRPLLQRKFDEGIQDLEKIDSSTGLNIPLNS